MALQDIPPFSEILNRGLAILDLLLEDAKTAYLVSHHSLPFPRPVPFRSLMGYAYYHTYNLGCIHIGGQHQGCSQGMGRAL